MRHGFRPRRSGPPWQPPVKHTHAMLIEWENTLLVSAVFMEALKRERFQESMAWTGVKVVVSDLLPTSSQEWPVSRRRLRRDKWKRQEATRRRERERAMQHYRSRYLFPVLWSNGYAASYHSGT